MFFPIRTGPQNGLHGWDKPAGDPFWTENQLSSLGSKGNQLNIVGWGLHLDTTTTKNMICPDLYSYHGEPHLPSPSLADTTSDICECISKWASQEASWKARECVSTLDFPFPNGEVRHPLGVVLNLQGKGDGIKVKLFLLPFQCVFSQFLWSKVGFQPHPPFMGSSQMCPVYGQLLVALSVKRTEVGNPQYFTIFLLSLSCFCFLFLPSGGLFKLFLFFFRITF